MLVGHDFLGGRAQCFLHAGRHMHGKPFAQLTCAGQVRRLRLIATAALERYGITDAQLQLLSTTQGVVYRVDAAGGERFVLRVSPADAPSPVMQGAQLRWLQTIAAQTPLCVPEPVALPNGAWWITIAVNSVDEPRQCVLLRWVAGRARRAELITPTTAAAIGTTIARLHQHAQQYRSALPADMRRWNSEQLVGAGSCLGNGLAHAHLPPEAYDTLVAASAQIGATLDAFDLQPHAAGLIHADLGVHNFVFARGQACPIDFDEWGYGAYLFDLAAPLRSFLPLATYSTLRDALLTAYARIQPRMQITGVSLNTCIAAQCMGYINWLVRFAPAYAAKAMPEVMHIKQLCAV